MFCIVVYDSNEPNKFKKLFRQYFYHLQKSVFEGEINHKNLEILKKSVRKIVKNGDFVKLYLLDHKFEEIIYGEEPDFNHV